MNAHRLLNAASFVAVSLLLSGCNTPLIRDASMPPEARQDLVTEGKVQDLVTEVQEMLLAKGFDPGPVDGIAGHRTLAALAKFQLHTDCR